MIQIPVSVGELIDKLSILLLKRTKCDSQEKRKAADNEFDKLKPIAQQFLESKEITDLYDQLVDVNDRLWDIEDEIRHKERRNEFDKRFVELARSVYRVNDERFALKDQINALTGSEIKEVKSYVNYHDKGSPESYTQSR